MMIIETLLLYLRDIDYFMIRFAIVTLLVGLFIFFIGILLETIFFIVKRIIKKDVAKPPFIRKIAVHGTNIIIYGVITAICFGIVYVFIYFSLYGLTYFSMWW